ncbi:MAG: hypothetical protein IH950_03165 [Bacteroidetes bacterium]|nr:hypothetical protein [Bacteroidota bacterium]
MKNKFYNILILSIIFLYYAGCRESVNEAPDIGITIKDPGTIEKINILAPVKDAIFEPGGLIQVRWLSSESLSKIDVFLFRKNMLKQTLISNQDNRGTFDWLIPLDFDNSIHYSIKVVNSSRETNYGQSGSFSIKNSAVIKIKP